MIVYVIIPALNEEDSIALVIKAIPKYVNSIIVVDNGSKDRTAEIAKSLGAIVLSQSQKGYGIACLTAIEYISSKLDDPDVVAFMDADYSDYPEDLELLLVKMEAEHLDLVIGSRVALSEPGSLTSVQKFGNALSTSLIKWVYNHTFTDLGPFRVIGWKALQSLHMKDQDFGWTVEMQIKAAKLKLRCGEVNVRYRKRIGESKISGTLLGSYRAGKKILYTIYTEAFTKSK